MSHRRVMEAIQPGPSWIDSARYTIEAKAEGAPTREMMRGPMLQALLEDRFQLKVHRETREVAVYELKIAPGGARLQGARQGNCVILRNSPPPEPLPPICGGFTGEYMYSSTMANLCGQLSVVLDRDVVEKAGIPGVFDIHFEGIRGYASNATLAAALEATIPKLGLQLEPAKASGKYLVIDRAEKPSGN